MNFLFRYRMRAFSFPAKFYCALIFCLLFTLTLHAAEPDADLDAANRAFTAGNYDEAAKLFQQIVTTRGYSAAVCFDLANAESKAGRTGDAILNYERARYLAPGDRDINLNLQAARKKAGLEPNPFRWWQIVLLSINWTIWLDIMGGVLVLIFVAVIGTTYVPALATVLKIPVRPLRNTFRLILFAGIPFCLLMGFIELSTIGFNNRIEGVIVAPKSATLRLSPFATADTIGTIPEGELVTVENRHNDYLWIEARDHHFGWIEAHDIEPVIAGAFDAKP
jgi:tetratricopeptide (TPR) repeat protein